MFNCIVVPLDGSELAERALGPARMLAKHSQSELLLVRVAVAQPLLLAAEVGYGMVFPDATLSEAHQQATDYLTSLRKSVAGAGQAVRLEIPDGEVAGAIVDTARQARAGLIIMSSHGYSGVNRWLLGSVAEKVLNAAPCPVWVVRAPAPPRHLLLTLDGSRLAEEALPAALALARCFGARVTLLRVVPDFSVSELETLNGFERGLGRRWVDETREAAASDLAAVVDRCDIGGPELKTAVWPGPAAETILTYAEQNEVDLIAMTTHGRTGLRRWLYGSVTHKVLDQWPASMLVVPPPAVN